jgi:hypothetical protein
MKHILPLLFIIPSLLFLPACKKTSSQGTPVKTYTVTLGNPTGTAYGSFLNIPTGTVYSCSSITDSASSSKVDIAQDFYMTSAIVDFDAPSCINSGCAFTSFVVKQPTSLINISLPVDSFNAIQYDSQLQAIINANLTGGWGGCNTVPNPGTAQAMLVKTFGGVYALIICTNISGNGSSGSSYAQYTVKLLQ